MPDLEVDVPGRCKETEMQLNITEYVLFSLNMPAFDLGDAPGIWFDELMGTNGMRLVQRANTLRRWAGSIEGTGNFDNSFADTAPILLASEASLRRLNGWLKEKGGCISEIISALNVA